MDVPLETVEHHVGFSFQELERLGFSLSRCELDHKVTGAYIAEHQAAPHSDQEQGVWDKDLSLWQAVT
jgi:hypothetical protein